MGYERCMLLTTRGAVLAALIDVTKRRHVEDLVECGQFLRIERPAFCSDAGLPKPSGKRMLRLVGFGIRSVSVGRLVAAW